MLSIWFFNAISHWLLYIYICSLILWNMFDKPESFLLNEFSTNGFLGDVARVNGQLAVSRAFGDKNLKTLLSSDPDIQVEDTSSETELLILASDGLWKVLFIIVHASSNHLSLTHKRNLNYCIFLPGYEQWGSCQSCKKNQESISSS